MTRPMSEEKEREYAELSAFLDMYATHFMKLDPKSSIHPTNVGTQIVEAVGKSKALVGLRQAINDSVDGLQDLTYEQVAQLDTALRGAGIVTLTELRRRHSRKYKSILKRGLIRNDTEFYLIKAILDDCADMLAGPERDNLASMLLAFEHGS